MAFSKSVREGCLVLSARHCCVCHRYKGVKVEVHHILPLEQGGKDDAENAIALCFDCHADAGHYHAKHPKGTRVSPEELKKHKASWYAIVANGKVSPPSKTSDAVVVRHLVCRSWEVVTEIINRDYSKFPVADPLFYQNATYKFLESIVAQKGTVGRSENEYGEDFSSPEEIKARYPECIVPPRDRYPSFNWARELTSSDISRISDEITIQMHLAGTPAKKLGEALYHYGECGEPSYYELFHLRPIEVVFLTVQNISAKPLIVNSYQSRSHESASYELSEFGLVCNQNLVSNKLPSMNIKPNETVVICEAIVVGPLGLLRSDANSSVHQELTSEKGQSFSRFIHEPNSLGPHDILGPYSFVESVDLLVDGNAEGVDVHTFDQSNYYLIDRYWMCGSCPHIFVKSAEDDWRYLGEGLGAANVPSASIHPLSSNVSEIMLAELEHEITWLSRVWLVDQKSKHFDLCQNLSLEEGDFITLQIDPDVEFPAILHISGTYQPLGATNRSAASVVFRNDLVARHLACLHESKYLSASDKDVPLVRQHGNHEH